MLEDAGEFEVVREAANGSEAIDCVREVNPDILILDISMPVLDGIAAAAAIRENKLDVRIIMLTADESTDAVLASIASGAQGYCLKSVSTDRLRAGIKCVQLGDFWIDRDIATAVRSSIKQQRMPVVSDRSNSEKEELSKPISDKALTARELEVLDLMSDGCSNATIAKRMNVSAATVKNHVSSILDKLSASDRTVAAVKALRAGIIR